VLFTYGHSCIHLLQQIDANVAKHLSQPWKATLPVNGLLCSRQYSAPPLGDDFIPLDLFHYTDPTWKGYHVRFDTHEFPVVPGGLTSNKEGRKKLVKHLSTISHLRGSCQLISNGGGKSRYHYLCCSRSKKYQSFSNLKVDGPFRNSTMECDRNNSRGSKGNSQPKRSTTGRPIAHDQTCKAKICIDVDDFSFFMVCGIGDSTHNGHPPLSPHLMATPSRLVPDSAHTLQCMAANANIRPGQTASLVLSKYGLRLTRRQVAKTQSISQLLDALPTEEDKSAECSDSDRVFRYLQKKKASYIALFHSKSEQNCNNLSERPLPDFLWVEAVENPGNSLSIPMECKDCMDFSLLQYARDSRAVTAATDDQDVLISVAWALPSAKRLFNAFPEVLFIDGTHKTNNEDRPLITMGVKDMDGKVQIVLRCWAPNERAWMFRWLFQSAVPTIFGREACQRIRLIITDGDSQEYTQLDDAIAAVFVKARRRRCGWHIVAKGWDRHVRFHIGKTPTAQKLSSTVKTWLYSLMKSVETVDEYNV